MAKKSAEGFIATLQDPDMVGASEYRVIHELLSDIVLGMDEVDEEHNLGHLSCVLDEVIGRARQFKQELKRYRKGK